MNPRRCAIRSSRARLPSEHTRRAGRSWTFSVVVLAWFVSSACGASPSRTASPEPPPTAPAVFLSLSRTNGETIEVASLRGAPLLLYVFVTWDGVSQALLNPLRAVVARHPELRVVGIAAQPDGSSLVSMWEKALEPPFPIAVDAQGELTRGESALGRIEAVPLLVLLDRHGVIVDRHVGFATRAAIEAMLAKAK